MTSARLAVLVAAFAGCAVAAAAQGTLIQAKPQEPAAERPVDEPALPPAPPEVQERSVGPDAGRPHDRPRRRRPSRARAGLRAARLAGRRGRLALAGAHRLRRFPPGRHPALPARRGAQRLRRGLLPEAALDRRHRHRDRPLPERTERGRALPADDRPQAVAVAAPAARRGPERHVLRAAERAACRPGPGAQPDAHAPAHRGRRGGGVLRRDRAAPAARRGAPEPGAHRGPAEVLGGTARGRPGEQARRLPRRAAGGAGARRDGALAVRSRHRARAIPRAARAAPGRPRGARGRGAAGHRRRLRAGRGAGAARARRAARAPGVARPGGRRSAQRLARQAEPAAAVRPQRRASPSSASARRSGPPGARATAR